MPDLSSQGSHKFWHEHSDPMIYRAISFMESVEDWSIEGDAALEQAIAKLEVVLDDIGYIDLQAEEKLINFASSIRIGRMLRLLQCMDVAHPGAASKIFMFAKNASQSPDDVFGLFLRRNVVFERLRVLGRIFSSERLAAILQVLGNTEDKKSS